MCIPAEDGLVDVTQMAGSELVGGTVVANRAVIQSGAMLSYRSFTPARAAEYGYSASLAHVHVHVDGGARTVSTQTAAGIQKIFDGTAWADGNTGTDIYLGNIERWIARCVPLARPAGRASPRSIRSRWRCQHGRIAAAPWGRSASICRRCTG